MDELKPEELRRIEGIIKGLEQMRDRGANVALYEAVFFLRIIDRLLPGEVPEGWNPDRRGEACYDPHCPHHSANWKPMPSLHFCAGTPCFCGDRR